ncbi:cytochrome c [Ferruginibacter lapsinanis]|uniref:c-type cytochrome n=1 Tax=Ferruginibacter lapsinanis TaxID=563172 RepID=UPI001E386226|nr:cytochrome c [Ferruginibacter lapsinanis]UEG50203.1 cytochrome c [Ferruginibacter lapsinanis]
MRSYLLLIAILTCFFFSCTDKENKIVSKLLNEDNLQSQFFTIDINRDTVVQTAKGCIIQIPKGSLLSDSNKVRLEIKEALSNTDIVLAGLSTMAGKQALSSGGMIYFDAASGYKVEIKKQLSILVPTKTYNREMKVFKGDTVDGKINWTNPSPLPEDETTKKLDHGKDLFTANCGNCHKVYEELTGPALYGITDKRSKEWIYAFTRHNFFTADSEKEGEGVYKSNEANTPAPENMYKQVQLHDGHPGYLSEEDEAYIYHECQKKKYGAEMTAFPNLSNKDIDVIFSYIKNETDKRPDLKEKLKDNCCDSCIAYYKASARINEIENKRKQLIRENENFFSLNRVIPNLPPAPPDTIPAAPALEQNTKVTPVNTGATYYTINITATGWYNIDILMKDYSNCVPSELMVHLQGNYSIDFNVTLIIPSVKAFINGGKLGDGKGYGFDEADGRIPLPQGANCIVLAFAENDGKIVYGKAVFNAQTKQTINISISAITKDELKKEIMALGLDNVSADITDSKNADKIREADKELKEIERLKPKNCDCGITLASTMQMDMPVKVPTAGNY